MEFRNLHAEQLQTIINIKIKLKSLHGKNLISIIKEAINDLKIQYHRPAKFGNVEILGLEYTFQRVRICFQKFYITHQVFEIS